VHKTAGHLNMTTVSQRDDLTLGQALTLWNRKAAPIQESLFMEITA